MATDSENTLSILYQDEDYLVVNKPPGLLVHRTSIDSRETQFAVQTLRNQIGRRVYPAHRLDKPTSGILLFTLNEEALRDIQKYFESCRIEKTYLAIVRGHPPDSGQISHPLRRMLEHGPKAKSNVAQQAETDYRTLSTVELPYPAERYPSTRYALVELSPRTGRRHQLRRHLSHINCPIIGDTKHGDTRRNLAFRERYGFVRLFLHASRMAFEHPATGQKTEIKAPLWPDFQTALTATGLTLD